eukprot:15162850-Alexandrium_andersonii.AAC.1
MMYGAGEMRAERAMPMVKAHTAATDSLETSSSIQSGRQTCVNRADVRANGLRGWPTAVGGVWRDLHLL